MRAGRALDGVEARARGRLAGASPSARRIAIEAVEGLAHQVQDARRAPSSGSAGASTHLEGPREARHVGDGHAALEAVLGLELAQACARARPPGAARPRPASRRGASARLACTASSTRPRPTATARAP